VRLDGRRPSVCIPTNNIDPVRDSTCQPVAVRREQEAFARKADENGEEFQLKCWVQPILRLVDEDPGGWYIASGQVDEGNREVT
jgi:hypothetical protein